jgi:glutamine amidotransferase
MTEELAIDANITQMSDGPNILIVDYESGNLRSVARAIEKAGIKPQISGDPATLESADAVVLPGVGSGDAAMAALRERELVEPLKLFIASGRPFLGVCLGLQLLMSWTEEGNTDCLGVFSGNVRHLPPDRKVPHMGWNRVRISADHPVLDGLPRESYFYFVHSYYVDPKDSKVVIGSTDYGVTFPSICAEKNVIATQFHPEKSGSIGLRIYKNFVEHVQAVDAGSL